MICDVQTTLLDKGALTSTGTTVSNAYDTGIEKSDLGRGRPIRAKVTVDTAFTTGAGGTLAVNYIQSANSDLSSPDILATLLPATGVSGLTAGASLYDGVLPSNTKRYVGFQNIIATGAMTAGNLTEQFVLDTNSAALYPAAT